MPLSPAEVQDLAQRFVRCRRLAEEAAAQECKLRDEAMALADALREPMQQHPVIVLHDPAGAVVLSLLEGGLEITPATVLGALAQTPIQVPPAAAPVVPNLVPKPAETVPAAPTAGAKPGRTRRKGVETGPGPSSTVPVGDPPALTGFLCSVCGEPQFKTPSGDTCKNGHTGAQPFTQEQWDAARASDSKDGKTPAPAAAPAATAPASDGMELPGQAPASAPAPAPTLVSGVDSETLRRECRRVAMILSANGKNGEILVKQAMGAGISQLDPKDYQKAFDAVRAMVPVPAGAVS